MKKTILASSLIVCGLAFATGCQKENMVMPEWAMRLTTENYSDNATKTSVQDCSVQWVGSGETVNINGMLLEVHLTDAGAYVSPDDPITGTMYGYYPADIVTNGNTTTPTVTIPSTYASSMDDDGWQVIALPMAAYAATAGNDVEFKHLTAAV